MHIFDPFYWYLRFAHRPLLRTTLQKEEEAFVTENINKHRLIQWINLFAGLLVYWSLQDSMSQDEMGHIITALIAPVMVMGTAWFAISFGAIPARLIDFSMSITFWMYTGFKVSLTTMFIAISQVTDPLLWPVLFLIYIAIDFSCAQYDTADGLKAGLDDALLNHSRAALIYYQHQGIHPEHHKGGKK